MLELDDDGSPSVPCGRLLLLYTASTLELGTDIPVLSVRLVVPVLLLVRPVTRPMVLMAEGVMALPLASTAESWKV